MDPLRLWGGKHAAYAHIYVYIHIYSCVNFSYISKNLYFRLPALGCWVAGQLRLANRGWSRTGRSTWNVRGFDLAELREKGDFANNQAQHLETQKKHRILERGTSQAKEESSFSGARNPCRFLSPTRFESDAL